nr:hypothetical protein [Niallia circulans]
MLLLNKLQRLETKPHLITETKLKELHREYEKLLIDKENHLDIDYMVANDEQVKKHKHEIIKYKQKELFIKILVITSPVIFMLANLFNKKIC